MPNNPEIESPPAQELRDRIYVRLTKDDSDTYDPIECCFGLPPETLQHIADIAFAVIGEQPARPDNDRDGWVTFGHIKVDIENETETFTRIEPRASGEQPVAQIGGVLDRDALLHSLKSSADIAEGFRDQNSKAQDYRKADILERDREVCQGYHDRIQRGEFDLHSAASPAAQSRAGVDREELVRILQDRLLQYNEQHEVQRARDNGSHSSIRNIARLESARSELDFVLRDINRVGDFDLPDASEDSRRLDWMTKNQAITYFNQRTGQYQIQTITSYPLDVKSYDTARECIDVAMQPDKERAND